MIDILRRVPALGWIGGLVAFGGIITAMLSGFGFVTSRATEKEVRLTEEEVRLAAEAAVEQTENILERLEIIVAGLPEVVKDTGALLRGGQRRMIRYIKCVAFLEEPRRPIDLERCAEAARFRLPPDGPAGPADPGGPSAPPPEPGGPSPSPRPTRSPRPSPTPTRPSPSPTICVGPVCIETPPSMTPQREGSGWVRR